MTGPEIRISGNLVEAWQDGSKLFEGSLQGFIGNLLRSSERKPCCGILPSGVRAWHERGNLVALAIEVPPHARRVTWIAANSPAPFGKDAVYEERFLAFPYVEILLVLRAGELTGYQQLFYRTRSIDEEDNLYLPNLLNVARAYRQRAWLCLVKMQEVGQLSWPGKVRAVVDHVFTAGFNRSAEVNEGNSYWEEMQTLDPRIASLEAWEQATRENPRFVLELPWLSARTTVSNTLTSMLDQISPCMHVETAEQLSGVLIQSGER